MLRLPDQFDPQARVAPDAHAVAGGGSTSTTCSSCVVTLLGTSVLAGEVFASAAKGQGTADNTSHAAPPEPPQPHRKLGTIRARLLGWATAPALLALVGLSFQADAQLVGLALLLAVGGFVAISAYVYGATQGRPGKGVAIGIGLLVLALAVSVLEMLAWLS
ncbi:MAG: hypothetical protein Q4G70_08500 [Pseudomonadota bacterium]|nr:hypothetical protein [Pseudomonadota bacterium]